MHTAVFFRNGDILESLRLGSPKPGHIERISGAKLEDKTEDTVITQRFLKINVRHITDGQGVVSGVLLVTPNAVMFDPNVSDALVIEHGAESYGVIAPMELVVNAAIFYDIAHMRVSGGIDSNQNETAEIYYPKSVLEAIRGEEQTDEESKPADDENIQIKETKDDSILLDSTHGDHESFGLDISHSSSQIIEAPKEAKEYMKTDVDKNENSSSTNTTAGDQTNTEIDKGTTPITDVRPKLTEGRKSLLDHHWAVPRKSRLHDIMGDNECDMTTDSVTQEQQGTSNSSGGENQIPHGVAAVDLNHLEQLSKQPCYDSGIDINEPIPSLQPIPKKAVYSDADIVLSSDWVPPKSIDATLGESPPQCSTMSAKSLDAEYGNLDGQRKKTSSVSFSVEENANEPTAQAIQIDKNFGKKSKMLKRLSYPLTWVEALTGDSTSAPSTGGSLNKSSDTDSAPNTGDSNQSVFSKVFSRRSSIATFMRPHSSEGSSSTTKLKDMINQPKLDYRSMVSVDDKPELFISVDKLIPRPARACADPPLYLRLRMGKPIGKAISLPTSVTSYGRNKLRPEYWFSVPKNRVDELYRFMNTWVPHLYGELDEEKIKSLGYELLQDDTEWTKSGSSKASVRNECQEGEESSALTHESWEVLSTNTDEYRRSSLFANKSFDLDFPIPDLIGNTEILTEEHREKLCAHLPARAEGYSWSLVFSTSQHGFSLNSLYRKMQRLESPILIVIEDTQRNVFGALTSCALHVSDHFYGTGESLLYKFHPSFKVFHWTGENLYFIKGNVESLSIGAGDGRFGLWLDSDLNQGRSQSCSTYGNEPLSSQEDFVIKTLECWAFI